MSIHSAPCFALKKCGKIIFSGHPNVQSQSLGIKVNSELNQRPPQTKQELFNGRDKEYKTPAQNQPYPIE